MAEYPTLTEQYSRHPAENNTYTLDADEDDRPWVRSFLPAGWGPWSRRDGGGAGWLDLLTNVAAHHATQLVPNTFPTYTLPGNGFNADYMQEIEIEVEAFGTAAFENAGQHGSVKMRRLPGKAWTTRDTIDGTPAAATDVIFLDPHLGSYKVRINDEIGVSVAKGDLWLDSEMANSTGRSSGEQGSPHRRYTFLVHLLGDPADYNQIRRVKVGPFSSVGAFTRLSIRMR